MQFSGKPYVFPRYLNYLHTYRILSQSFQGLRLKKVRTNRFTNYSIFYITENDSDYRYSFDIQLFTE